jgi:hypothetical protein
MLVIVWKIQRLIGKKCKHLFMLQLIKSIKSIKKYRFCQCNSRIINKNKYNITEKLKDFAFKEIILL